MDTQIDGKFVGDMLCKISRIEYLQQLQMGLVYMNRLDYYTKKENQENGDGFLDYDEGLVYRDVDITLECNGKKVVMQKVSARMGSAIPVFCCSRLKNSDKNKGERKDFFFDSRLIHDFSNGNEEEYGALLIRERDFIQRVQVAIDGKKLNHRMGLIRYEDFKNSVENVDDFPDVIFRKDPNFSYQQEFRVAIQKHVKEYFIFDIGNISDISYLVDLKMLKILSIQQLTV